MPLPPPGALLIQFRHGTGPDGGAGPAQLSELSARVGALGAFGVSPPGTPQDLVNFGQLRDLPLLTGAALGALTLLTIAHLLLTSVRQRRREIAVLRAIGFTPRQARAAVSWMAATLAAIALAAGIPLGIACGWLAWGAFAGQFGVQPAPVVPPGWFLILAAAALSLAVAIAAIPAAAVSRARPAQVLRAE